MWTVELSFVRWIRSNTIIIIDYGPDVIELDDYWVRNLMHVDHCRVIVALVRVVVLEIGVPHLVRVIHVGWADDRLKDFDFALLVNLFFHKKTSKFVKVVLSCFFGWFFILFKKSKLQFFLNTFIWFFLLFTCVILWHKWAIVVSQSVNI